MRAASRVLAAALLAPIFLGACAAPSAVRPAWSPNLGICPGPVNLVIAAFDLTHARDLWQHIPHFKGAPELEIDTPAHVVVYSQFLPGEYEENPMALYTADTRGGEVCVVINGDQTYYTNVDTTGVVP